MKKLLCAALMLFAASTATFAQHEVGSFTLQPKVGINVATLTDADGSDPRIGLAAGAELEYQATDLFSISAGAIYSQQGCKYEEGGVKTTTKLDYINVPILANVYVVKGLAVKLGVQPGFNVNSSIKAKAGGKSGEADFDAKSVDFSIPVGLSYELPTVPLVIDARYNWGLTKVMDGADSKNSVFQFTVGYKFSL
ncbi:MAG: porin family protein [Prevotella sp.]|jgi:hypothetical protein|nr:porin family protein [Prevotella sp.]